MYEYMNSPKRDSIDTNQKPVPNPRSAEADDNDEDDIFILFNDTIF